ncbi:PREDICTED: uncharacterized protein LOC105967845 [Erythranthe guttata]|uniref:uncharacterized protein LOC105967845 n=1 Tax=Erythranthe guttata TaxID=4155 RepID=UPI00064D95B5|nr:PREDICTED: uncharacterized protein LOC105967845 [Erythranthe guttata]|eukprot:XP_012847898.1 PREDICTED: uncharacterized protein LOC105967845 [Erythranthe guttata]
MCCKFPKQWSSSLALDEWWYNSTYHSAINMSPFQALYGYPPPLVGYGVVEEFKSVGVEQWVNDHAKLLQHLKELLQRARDRMKLHADKHRQERAFVAGDWVYLKLKPYKQLIVRRIGAVAYELQLPPTAKIHPVFHVSLLKKHVGSRDQIVADIPPMTDNGELLLVPLKVLDRRMVKRNNIAVGQMLVQWAHLPMEEATWEDADSMLQRFPLFHA